MVAEAVRRAARSILVVWLDYSAGGVGPRLLQSHARRYDARAARRGAAAARAGGVLLVVARGGAAAAARGGALRGAAAAFTRASLRALVAKQRSSAWSTL